MSISTILAINFSTESISSGASLYRSGAIVLTFITVDLLAALVRDRKNLHVVLIDVSEEDVGMHCTCSTFRTTDLCGHLWGAIRAADEMGGLTDLSEQNAEVISLTDEEAEKLFEEIERRIDAEEEEDDDFDLLPSLPEPIDHPHPPVPARSGNPSEWEDRLTHLVRSTRDWGGDGRGYHRKPREAFYILRGIQSPSTYAWSAGHFDTLVLDVGYREEKKNGELGALRFHAIRHEMISTFRTDEDRNILSFLMKVCRTGTTFFSGHLSSAPTNFLLPAPLAATVLDMIAPTGRLLVHDGHPEQNRPLTWSPEEVWTPELRIDVPDDPPGGGGASVEISLCFTHADQRMRSTEATYLATGLLRIGDRLVPVSGNKIDDIANFFSRHGSVPLPVDTLPEAMKKIQELGTAIRVSTAEDLPVATHAPRPVPCMSFSSESHPRSDKLIRGYVSFLYDDVAAPSSDQRAGIWNEASGTLLQRDQKAEAEFLGILREEGFAYSFHYLAENRDAWDVPKKSFVRATSALIERGWVVQAQGRSYRTGSGIDIRVTSGQDWFDIEGSASFDQTSLPFPDLLAAIDNGERFVLLDDGTYGLIPDEWVERYGPLAEQLGRRKEGLRFASHQMVLLDLMLAELPEASFDEAFVQRREKLQSFAGVKPMNPRRTFRGELRPYQQMALGWFSFLRDFNFGGCLADDMGLGKTVQVLALLEERRGKKGHRPSLAVVPKSLIFNWLREAERFTPKLRLLDYTGPLRHEYADQLDSFDLILTTYGTLRRDIAPLREVVFDYVILDESQAIKNPRSATAKAARLLQGEHRLAMSGTPVENRIEELWSLFEFLNPGMLGSAKSFRGLLESPKEGSEKNDADREESPTRGRAEKVGRILRPFILRRTKGEVATDLPERIEQTIYCDLGGTQRRLYDELRNYLRADVMNEIGDRGIKGSSFKILEAILRLRQAASHPGLLDPKRRAKGCAKFDILLPRLGELAAEGHKVLVFSQFTSLLDILRGELKKEELTYEYLDGQTSDRQACVDRFQSDPEIPIFLISLKAGGVGLNLTAASYVYLLDPWWNPAVEAQAIDRTHRIGQQNTVVAARLIARDTIEEKVLALQDEKRALADSIITGENSLISNLSREDLEMLLG